MHKLMFASWKYVMGEKWKMITHSEEKTVDANTRIIKMIICPILVTVLELANSRKYSLDS